MIVCDAATAKESRYMTGAPSDLCLTVLEACSKSNQDLVFNKEKATFMLLRCVEIGCFGTIISARS